MKSGHTELDGQKFWKKIRDVKEKWKKGTEMLQVADC